MKFIHTADWHLGNRMHDLDRREEYTAFFKWLSEKIVSEKADALVVSGDIFDTANPPTEAKAMYVSFLASLYNTDCRNIIITGGNHDSGSLLNSDKPIFEHLHIHVVGTVSNLKPEDMVFELYNKKGNAVGLCCAVPFAREIELRNYFDENSEDGTFCDNAYKSLYQAVLKAAKEKDNGRNLPIIATGHLYAADLEGRFESIHEEVACDDGRRKLDVVGKLGSVHAGIFSEEFDYIALGHIHYTTMVAKNPKIRYSGSPFILGFDEANLPRYVLSVEIEKHDDAKDEKGKQCKVEKIEIPRTAVYRRITGDCKSIKKILSEYDSYQELPVYIEIYYKKEDGINIHDELEEVINKIYELNVYVISRRMQKSDDVIFDGSIQLDSREVKNLNPEDIFKALISKKFPEDLSGLDEKASKKRKEEIINTYLPYFMEAFNNAQSNDFEGSEE